MILDFYDHQTMILDNFFLLMMLGKIAERGKIKVFSNGSYRIKTKLRHFSYFSFKNPLAVYENEK